MPFFCIHGHASKLIKISPKSGCNTVTESSRIFLNTVQRAISDNIKSGEDSDDDDGAASVYDAVYTLLNTIQHLAIVNPTHQDALITLLQSIQHSAPQTVQVPGKEGSTESIKESIVWADMPRFTHQLTDLYDYEHFLFMKSPSSESAISRWASVNAWLARLVTTKVKALGGVAFYMHRASHRFIRVLDVEGHPTFAGEIPAAANLFRYASPAILALCREKPSPPKDVDVGIFRVNPLEHSEGKAVLWSQPGYSMERWLWWKVRWGQLASDSELDEGIKTHAKDALTAMVTAQV